MLTQLHIRDLAIVSAQELDLQAGLSVLTGETGAGKPSLIACRTVIGFGAPNLQGSAATHGAPLGDDEVAAVRRLIASMAWSPATTGRR